MKRVLLLALMIALLLTACKKKEEGTERFRLLTGTVWQSEILNVEGEDASGPGEPLEKFVGDAEFYKDGTGYFGEYTGTWYFSNNENNITITSPDLAVPLTTTIGELTAQKFSISTSFPIPPDLTTPKLIEITFRAKP